VRGGGERQKVEGWGGERERRERETEREKGKGRERETREKRGGHYREDINGKVTLD